MSERIILAHGSGGRLAHDLIEELFVPAFRNDHLDRLEDAATLMLDGPLAFTTDSYVVNPIFFPGGDIGKLAVCGTVNDLAMAGATPKVLSLGMILEEGLERDTLARIVESIARTAQEAGVAIVTGDTKVVQRGAADRIFINTAGIGVVPPGVAPAATKVRPGDRVLVNGYIGDHGIAVISKREGLQFEANVETDCAPLGGLVGEMLAVCPEIRCLRDPTRGGVATTLNEIAAAAGMGIRLQEEAVPVRDVVLGACEMLGFDPLYVANEGKVLAFVPAKQADAVLEVMRAHVYGRDAACIGEVTAADPGRVILDTVMGASRIVDMLTGEMLPRIC